MLIPTAAVLITRRPPRLQWKPVPLRYLASALFLIPAVFHAVMLPLLSATAGGLRWQSWLTPESDGLYHSPETRGWGVLTLQGLIGHILLNAVAGLVIVSVLALFEEIGWRAW